MPRDIVKATAAAHASRQRKKELGVLTTRERAFVLHYLGAARLVAADAAKLAGFAPDNREGQCRYGYTLLRKEKIITAIEAEIDRRNQRLEITADHVLNDLVEVRDEAKILGGTQGLKVRLAAIEKIGQHVAVAAFRHQIGLGSPTGGPVEVADMATLAKLSDEELETLERARAIYDRATGSKPPEASERVGDPGGERTSPQEP